jgi:two-component system, NtrC family, response regulator AtoC
MDRRIALSLPPTTAAIPELDVFDLATFDALPIWGAPAVSPQPPVILVVDDELHVGEIVRRLLHEVRPEQEIIAVTHPTDALDQIRGRAVALMITDFNMPDRNGVQLTAAVKGHSPRTQVLLMTAYSTALLRRLARHQGVDYYLPKPFRLTDLEALVGAALTAYDAHLALL